MNCRLAQLLTGLYPPSWRARYGEEFKTFLEVRPAGVSSVLNVIGSAFVEHFCSFGDYKMSRLQRSLVLMVYAYLATIAAGVNLVMTVDDTPLVEAMRAHAALSACWNLVAAGSLVSLAAIATVGFPTLWEMIRFVSKAKRPDIAARLAFPICTATLIFAWIIVVTIRTGWAPLFWDVMGQPLMRWALTSVTLMLVVFGSIGSAIGLKQAIERSVLPEQQLTIFGRAISIEALRLAKLSAIILASSIAAMALGVAGWGLLADRYAPAAFRANDGGFFGTPNIVSWMGSLGLFIAAAVTALRSARWATPSHAD